MEFSFIYVNKVKLFYIYCEKVLMWLIVGEVYGYMLLVKMYLFMFYLDVIIEVGVVIECLCGKF